jgi:hypothetical protein
LPIQVRIFFIDFLVKTKYNIILNEKLIKKMAYTKKDIVEAGLLRFRLAKKYYDGEALIVGSNGSVEAIRADLIDIDKLEKMFNDFYDEHGKDEFRKYASVDAECMRKYFNYKAD